MKKNVAAIIVCTLILGIALYGCGAKKADSSRDAISISKTMATTQEKVNYLVSQAKSFYGSKEFQGAVDIAQYVLRYLDSDSAQAKKLLDDAKAALTAEAQKRLEDAKKGIFGS